MIYNTDCIKHMEGMESGSIDAIITDPPYGYLKHKLDAVFNEGKFFSECYRVLKKESFLVFFGRGVPFHRWNIICDSLGFEFLEEIIWDKITGASPCHALMRNHETVSVFRKGKKPISKVRINKIERDLIEAPVRIIDDLKRIVGEIQNIKTIEELEKFREVAYDVENKKKNHFVSLSSSVKSQNRATSAYHSHVHGSVLTSIVRVRKEHREFVHPTQKPVELMQHLINLVSDSENDVILDPFMGGGSTGVACRLLNKKFIGCEIDLEYFSAAEKRINNTVCQLKLTA